MYFLIIEYNRVTYLHYHFCKKENHVYKMEIYKFEDSLYLYFNITNVIPLNFSAGRLSTNIGWMRKLGCFLWRNGGKIYFFKSRSG